VNKTDRTVTFQIGLTIAVLVGIAVLIGYLSSSYTRNASEKVVGKISDSDMLFAEANQRILPIGHVITQEMKDACEADPACEGIFPDTPEVVAVTRTGAEVVDYLCASCHIAGVGGAPKLDDAADWGTRYAQGMDALMVVGLNGKDGTTMMPKGGDSSLSEDDIWNSIVAMLNQAGVSISETERVAETTDAAAEDTAAEGGAAQESAEESAVEAAPAAENTVVPAATETKSAVSEVIETGKESASELAKEAGTKMKTMVTTPAEMIVDTATMPVIEAGQAVSQ